MKPTHARYWVVGFALDPGDDHVHPAGGDFGRPSCPSLSELHLDKRQTGLVLGAFGLSYALFEIPMGLGATRLGVRRVLTQVVLLWSLFTALTGAAWNMVFAVG